MKLDDGTPDAPDWVWLRERYADTGLLHEGITVAHAATLFRGRMGYLAAPYSRLAVDEDGKWELWRSTAVELKVARWLMQFTLWGATVVSPVTLSCAANNWPSVPFVDPLDPVLWERINAPMLAASAAVAIATIDGWDRSTGVWREACWALQHQRPVFILKGLS